jgi:exopolysaccharide biosynthesis protein
VKGAFAVYAALGASALLAQAGPAEPVGLRYEYAALGPGVSAHVITVDLSDAEMRLLDARDLGAVALTAREFQERTGATAVVNGPFFDLDGSPMGLLIVDGEARAPLRPVDWGVFALDADGPSIVHTRDWTDRDGVRQAFQVGPRLMVEGQPMTLKRQSARRTALCVLSDRRVQVAVVDQSLDASRLAAFLAEQGCVDALNLDGGGSSQLYLKSATAEVDVPGDDPIPVAVGFFARGTAEIQPRRGCGCL